MKRILLFILLLTNTAILFAEDKLNLGLGWPYVGLKYNLSQGFSSELRYANGEGINVYAGRLYWNFYKPKNLDIFAGIEGGNITFNTLDIKGTGYEGSVFIGGECFISKRLSLMMDIEPVFISLNSDDLGVEGVEWVTNFAVYFHFGKADKEEHKMSSENIINTEKEKNKEILPSKQQVEEQGCIIKGKIIDFKGNSIPGVLVKLIKDNKEILFLKTTENGKYKINKIVSGSYVMIFRKKGYKGIRKPIILEKSGKSIEVNIILNKNK
jgi:hypothetical protein